jgi:hypothetical protein
LLPPENNPGTRSQTAARAHEKHETRPPSPTALVNRFSFGFGLVPSRDPAGGTSYFAHKKKKVKNEEVRTNQEVRDEALSTRSSTRRQARARISTSQINGDEPPRE